VTAPQLSRIGKPSEAQIVKAESPYGIETYKWWCPVAVERFKARGWQIREVREPGHELRCQDHAECGA